jgi:hypothetical protein
MQRNMQLILILIGGITMMVLEDKKTRENINRILQNVNGFFGEYNPEKAEQKRIEKENYLKIKSEKEQNKIELEKENQWQELNKKWRIEAQEKHKNDITEYRKQLQDQKIPVELLTDNEIFIAGKFYGMKISRDIIFNKCKILV